ncbi:hypothetical protein EVG20_g7182 [Dentipellis fragilis]|uniref:Uncharacterized protein n=1 Tax=Dentipellis fragilis TaxID=205917 RepID=A0A4Y9YI41_9AGAM|nr:hypothetical protein EVG20_g7182 [Dentipellis fragilis]
MNQQPSMSITLTEEEILERLRNLISYTAAHMALESCSYGAFSHLFSQICMACTHTDTKLLIASHPQSHFEGEAWDDVPTFRIPDFALLGNYSQSVLPRLPSYRRPFLWSWVEIKPLLEPSGWFTEEAYFWAYLKTYLHISQVCEQAYYAFQQYEGKIFDAILFIGPYATVLRFTRPSHGRLASPLPYSQIIRDSQTAAVYADELLPGRQADQSVFLSPHTPPNITEKRKLDPANTEGIAKFQSLQISPSTAEGSRGPEVRKMKSMPTKMASTRQPPVLSREAASLKLDIICFNESANRGLTLQGGLFGCPTNNYTLSEESLREGRVAIEKAFKRPPPEDIATPEASPWVGSDTAKKLAAIKAKEERSRSRAGRQPSRAYSNTSSAQGSRQPSRSASSSAADPDELPVGPAGSRGRRK